MGTDVIKVMDLIGTANATLPAFGEIIYEAARQQILKKQPVTIDFTGIKKTTLGFFNASIGNLVSLNPDNNHLVKVQGLLHTQWRQEIKNVIVNALNPNKKLISQEKLNSLFTD